MPLCLWLGDSLKENLFLISVQCHLLEDCPLFDPHIRTLLPSKELNSVWNTMMDSSFQPPVTIPLSLLTLILSLSFYTFGSMGCWASCSLAHILLQIFLFLNKAIIKTVLGCFFARHYFQLPHKSEDIFTYPMS